MPVPIVRNGLKVPKRLREIAERQTVRRSKARLAGKADRGKGGLAIAPARSREKSTRKINVRQFGKLTLRSQVQAFMDGV
jgi:hypothetical protein